eukprot:CAMPEP_0173184980 /NCGR_PEP_ID=MMETSP1141-20130122/9282_1 /TAXON_ID=483371 /ORGANISM="non described non described, Strain CCMP2298" /LENGTH=76 /DNA_ID=CAMNT_0014108421 /DNA_START=59 /DNA_END=289 /DNA_ORIENTATION=+
MATQVPAIQSDWENREFVEVVQINILSIVNFLNQFDLTVRSKLSTLNEKMNKLERSVEYCEAATKSSLEKQIADRN